MVNPHTQPISGEHKNWQDPTPSWVSSQTFNGYIRNDSNYLDMYGKNINDMLTSMENVTRTKSVSLLTNSVSNTIKLRQNDFHNGTVRLTKPGIYILEEDIDFEPNPNDNWMPTPAQTAGGAEAEYPVAPYGPYHMGFFAAITIEGNDITLDLNGKVIRQTNVFNIQQRFYANIELASSPFIPKQGPSDFGSNFSAATNSVVMNGYLGLSSHHGIHGNGMSKIIIQNLVIFGHEVAGIALNGGEDILIRNNRATNMTKNIPILSTYSAARFSLSFLKAAVEANQDGKLNFTDGSKSGAEILSNLEDAMDNVLTDVKAGKELEDSFFKNNDGVYDGGAYGLVLNSRGVVVHGFAEKKNISAIGNKNIIVHDFIVENMEVGDGEIIGLCKCNPDIENTAYGGAQQVGPAGDVFQVLEISEDGKYIGTPLSDAQLFIAKYGGGGTTNIEPYVIEWAESREIDIMDILIEMGGNLVSGGDSMAHTMKGLIGIFISQGDNIKMRDITVRNLVNNNELGQEYISSTPTQVGVHGLNDRFDGATTRGVAIVSSTNVTIKNITVDGLVAKGVSCGVDVMGECSNIRCREGVNIKNIVSGTETTLPPNPICKPMYINISSKSDKVLC